MDTLIMIYLSGLLVSFLVLVKVSLFVVGSRIAKIRLNQYENPPTEKAVVIEWLLSLPKLFVRQEVLLWPFHLATIWKCAKASGDKLYKLSENRND